MIQKHRKSMIFALSGVLLAALSSVLVLSACKSYAFNDVTVYHGGEQVHFAVRACVAGRKRVRFGRHGK